MKTGIKKGLEEHAILHYQRHNFILGRISIKAHLFAELELK